MHLSDKLTPLVPIDIFVLNDSEDSAKNEDKYESQKVALLKAIENKTEYLRKLRMAPVKIIPPRKN